MSDLPIAGIIGIGVCLIGSAFFSGSETALTSLGQAKAREIQGNGGKSTRILDLWIEKPSEVLTTILIGNNIVNITASALATQVAEQLLGGNEGGFLSPVAIAIGVMTLLLLTFGEITPKTLARANFQRLAVPILHMLRPFHFFFTPATIVFIKLSRWVARFTGRGLSQSGAFVTVEYLEKLVEIGGQEGSISEDDAGLIRSVLDFAETVAREVMVPRVDMVAVPVDITAHDLLRVFVDSGHSRVPVYRESVDDICGIFYAKDLLRGMASATDRGVEPDSPSTTLRPVRLVPETKPIDELLREMQEARVHMVVLVDEHGGVAGICTLEDIIEEIFGEIRDEHDSESDRIQQLDSNVWRLNAALNIGDLEPVLDVDFPDDQETDTLGGYFAKLFGKLPRRGDELVTDGLRLTIEDASDRRILWIRAEKLLEDEEVRESA